MLFLIVLGFLKLVSSGSIVLVEFPETNFVKNIAANGEGKSSNIELNENQYLAQIKAPSNPVEFSPPQSQLSANVNGQQLRNNNIGRIKYLVIPIAPAGELNKGQYSAQIKASGNPVEHSASYNQLLLANTNGQNLQNANRPAINHLTVSNASAGQYLAQIKASDNPVEYSASQNQLSSNSNLNPVRYILPSAGTPVIGRVHHSFNFFPYEQTSNAKIIQLRDYQTIEGANADSKNLAQSSQNYVTAEQQSKNIVVQNQPQLQANQQFSQSNSNSEKLIAYPGYLYFQPSPKVLGDPTSQNQKLISQSAQEHSKNVIVQSQPYAQSNQQFFQSNSEKITSHPSYLHSNQPSQQILSTPAYDSIQQSQKLSSQTGHLITAPATPSLQIVPSTIPNYSTSSSLHPSETPQHYAVHSDPLQSTSSLTAHESSAVIANPTVPIIPHQPVLDSSQPPVLRRKVYEIRRPAVQQHIYDIEERVVIRPAGSVVVELDQPGTKTETSQLIADAKLNYSIQGLNQAHENAYHPVEDDSILIQTARLKQANDAFYQPTAENKNIYSSVTPASILVADNLKAQQLQQATTTNIVGAEKIPQYQEDSQNLHHSKLQNYPVPFMIAIGEPDFGQYSHSIQSNSALKQEPIISGEYNKQHEGENAHEYQAAHRSSSIIRGDVPHQVDDSFNVPATDLHQTQNVNSANNAIISKDIALDKSGESNSQLVLNNQKQLAYSLNSGSSGISQIQNGSVNANLISQTGVVDHGHGIAAGEKVYTGKIIVSQPVETVEYVQEHEPLHSADYKQIPTIANDHHETNGKILKQ